MKKICFIILALGLMLSACTDTNANKSGENTNIKELNIKENLLESEGNFYNRTVLELPDKESLVKNAAKSNDVIYLLAIDNNGSNIFYKYDIEEGLCTELNIAISSNVHSIAASDNCLYILLNTSDTTEENTYEFKKYNNETNVLETIPLDKIIGGEADVEIAGFTVLDNSIYINAFNNIYCVDNSGALKATLKAENFWTGMLASDYEESILLYNDINNNFVVTATNGKLKPSCKYIFNTKYSKVFQGLSTEQVFVTDENDIYSLNLKTGDKKPYVNISLYNLNTSSFIAISDKVFFTIQNGVPTIWSRASEESEAQMTVLKCAAYDASFELQLAVSLFNYNHSDIKIEIIDYATFNDGLNALMVEITSGNTPDIIDLSNIPISAFNSKGLFENLEPRLLKKDLLPNIPEILKTDDGIFELVPGFQIAVLAGNSEYFSNKSLNIDDLLRLNEKVTSEGKYLFPQYLTREKFISIILSFSGDSFVDIDKAYCNFDNELFESLIEFARNLPSDEQFDEQLYTQAVIDEFGLVLDGKQLISMVETGNPVFELLKLRGLYKDNVSFMGFPSNSGNGIAMTPFLRLGMCLNSSNKDKAWTFFDYLLSEEFQSEMSKTNYMPVVNEQLHKYIDNIVAEYDEEPLRLAIVNNVLDCPLVDSNTTNDVWNIIEKLDCINEYDKNIYKIVMEECSAYFSGQKDVSEVIRLIQNRSSIYVSEKQ